MERIWVKVQKFLGESPSVRIREKRKSDDGLLIALRTDKEIQSALAAQTFSNSEIDAQNWIGRATGDTSRFFGVVETTETEIAVGFIQIFEWDNPDSIPQLGIAISHQFQGNNYGASTIALAMRMLRLKGAKYLQLEVREDNKRAYDLYARLGFEHVNSRFIRVFDGQAMLHRLVIDLDSHPV